MTQFCFDKCVTKFKNQDVVSEEWQCFETCVDKCANAWDGCIKRFQEYMLVQQQQIQQTK